MQNVLQVDKRFIAILYVYNFKFRLLSRVMSHLQYNITNLWRTERLVVQYTYLPNSNTHRLKPKKGFWRRDLATLGGLAVVVPSYLDGT